MKHFLISLIVIIMVLGCANPVPPSGGPKDETPPTLNTEESTPSEQTNYTERSFVLVFDEWVKLSDAYKELIVSPPIRYRPNINLKGKELTFEFDPRDTLQDNTTYTVQFGNGVKDLNENNPAENLNFVFSTGPYIDSLTLEGRITAAVEGESVEEFKVMLFDKLGDTIPLVHRPLYVSRTNENGSFKFENLRADTFRLIAIKDEDNNYMFSPGRESVAYSDTLIRLTRNLDNITLIGFNEGTVPQLKTKELQPDRLRLLFDQKVDTSQIQVLSDQIRYTESLGDSLIFWLESRLDSVMVVEKMIGDTTLVRRSRKVRRDTANIEMNKKAMDQRVNSKNDTLVMVFNRSIQSVDTTGMMVQDSSRNYPFEVTTNLRRQLLIKADWPQDKEIKVTIPSGALEGVNGQSNSDTLNHSFFVPAVEKLGTIVFTVDSLTEGPQRIVQLYLKDKLVDQFIVQPDREKQEFKFAYLSPGKYSVLIITDRNENGKWDTGNYLELRQPEHRIRKNLEPLRENWDLNVTLELERN